MLLSCAATAVHAQVDTPSPAKQTLDQQTPQVDLPDASASSGGPVEGGSELGITVGAFTLFPSISLNLGYDDNVFATTTQPVGSAVAVVTPTLVLQSEWLNHSVRLLANGGFGYYANAPTQNFQNYNLQADGKLDIRTDFYATGLIAFRRTTEALGTPNVSFAEQPTVVNSVPVELSLYQRFNRVFYQLSASATRETSWVSASARSRCFRRSSLNLGYDDNVFATTAPTAGSAVAVVSPTLELRSEWLNHSLRLLASGGFGFYANAPTQNFQNYTIQADGRLDIRNDIYASGLIAFRRSTEALGTPNVSFAAGADGGRFGAGRSVALSEVQSGLLPALRVGDEILVLRLQHDHARSACRRRAETAPSTRRRSSIGYEITEDLSLFIAPGFNQRFYVDTVNAAGQQRDSTGWNIGVGASLVLSATRARWKAPSAPPARPMAPAEPRHRPPHSRSAAHGTATSR